MSSDDTQQSETEDEQLAALAAQLFDYARHGGQEAVAGLTQALDHGLPVNLSDAKGNSLLMLAAYNDQVEVARLLLSRGADINRLNDRGQSPLAGVVFRGHDELLALLSAAGADPDLGTPTARATAQMFGKPELFADDPAHPTA